MGNQSLIRIWRFLVKKIYWAVFLGFLIVGSIVYHAYDSRGKIIVAIVDTGIDFNQIKFRFATTNGFNILNSEKLPQDDNGHGTQIASAIHYLEPRIRIMPIKAISKSGFATKQELAQGIIIAVDRGANIINISAGILSPSLYLEDAVNYAEKRGVLVVAAVGGNELGIEYPAAYPTVVAVGGVDSDGARIKNSNTGPELDVMALGEYMTTGLRGECLAGKGTSLATPIVSTYLARILLDNPNYTPRETRNIIFNLTKDIGNPGKDIETGYGLLTQGEGMSICTPSAHD